MENNKTQKILIADDDPLMRTLLSKLLKANGYDPYTVDNGYSALSRIAEENISLIITDLNMPGLNGEELCRVIREKKQSKYIYIIMITGQTDSDSLVNAMQAGADDFINKPVDALELKARLNAGIRVLELEADLAKRNDTLTDTLNKIRADQEEAKATLLSVLPETGLVNGVQFDWIFQSSKFIGGDTFDYFSIGDNRVGFYIVDVAGHGVTAAMQAFTIHNDMLTSIPQFELMSKDTAVLAHELVTFTAEYNRQFINRELHESYFTMLLGVLDIETGAVSLVQAGHPPAILIKSSNQNNQMIGDGGLPIGMVSDVSHDVLSFKMQSGDKLYLYSDGITECENAAGQLFGQEALVNHLANGKKTTEDVFLALKAKLNTWVNGNQFTDDITCLMIEYQ